MRPLLLKNQLSPGDVVMLTAAVRDLHASHPGRFHTDVSTTGGALWEHNPNVTRLEAGTEAEVISCAYPLIHRSNRTPHHFIHGFIQDLGDKLGVKIEPTDFKGDIHLSEDEKRWMSQVQEITRVPVLPPDPVPVTDGLVAWQRADVNVSLDGNNQVMLWGGADGCLPDAQRVTSEGPGWQENSFGVQPAVVFSGSEGLVLQSAGELGADSFTLVVAACSDSLWEPGGLFAPDSSQGGAVAAVAASAGQVTLSEPGGSGGGRLSADTPGCLCPLTIIYENKQARLYWLGNLVAQDSSAPPYDVWLPKLIGGTGSAGFVGRVAELLFYNRARGDSERQQVEGYLQDRYQCLPSGSSEMSSEQSSSESSSEEPSSEESLSSSSSSSSSESQSSNDNSSSSSSDSIAGDISIEGPSRIGITTPNKDRSVEMIVTTQNGNPNNIQLVATQGGGKVTIEFLEVSSESSAKFKVTGFEASDPNHEDDVTLEATCDGNTATKKLSVVIPVSVGNPRPLQKDFTVQAMNLASDNTTSPSAPTVIPPQKLLVVMSLEMLNVQINDQYGKALLGYGGTEVFESFNHEPFTSINQNLNAVGQYTDPTGLGTLAPDPPYSENPTSDAAKINQWLNASPSNPEVNHGKTQILRLQLDETWTLDAGTRDLLLKDPTTLHIDWQ